MIEAETARRLPSTLDRRGLSVAARYVIACLLLAPAVLALGYILTQSVAGATTAALVFAVFAGLAGVALRRHYPHDRLGIANIVTLSRAAIIAALCALLAAPGLLAQSDQLAWSVLAIAIFSLCLDGVDGYFARRQGLASDFGARFDMEIDSIFALLLALLCWQSGKAGAWVLALGSVRYLFLGAALVWPWLLAPLPERFTRKAICVVQIAVLIALLAPIISGPLSWSLAAIGTLLLGYSFGRDVIWLARHRS
ncbi:CDP-alcohol phosphatidyltransferase family protein [Devosia riboflavina]